MYTKNIDFFDLEQISISGQCFRMDKKKPGLYQVISGGSRLLISQEGSQITFDCPPEDLDYWLSYFDCSADYGKMIASINPKDLYLQEAAAIGRGIRILRQDPWEMILTFVISQQKTIPKIKEAVEALSLHYGSSITFQDHTCYAFPSPQQLSEASLEDLKALKLGYRAKYIYQLCRDCTEGKMNLDKLKAMNYTESMAYLTEFYGIGEKVANCVCLFGLHHIDAFPVDTWIQKILLREYYKKSYDRLPKNKLYETIVRDHFGRYAGCAGVMQQYIFHYERNILSKASL